MNLFGLSQLQLTQVLWICFIQLLINTTLATGEMDQKLENKQQESSKLSDALENAKNIDLELLSRAGDDPLKEILNAEESSVKEIKVEPSAELMNELKAKTAEVVDRSKEQSNEVSNTVTTSIGLTTLSSNSTISTTSIATTKTDQLVSTPVVSPTNDKQSADSKQSADQMADSNVVDKKVVHPVEDPLTSASSNVDNVKNEVRKLIKSDEITEISDEKLSADKIESKEIDELKATHRELDTSELNIEESRQSEDTQERMKLVCYYANWAVYRPGLAKFTPQNINPKLCTHIIYAFAGLSSKYEMKAFDPYNDINQGNYKKFTGLKVYNKNLKTMIAIGGWNEGSKRFSKLVADAELRKIFVDSVVKFLRQHQFDGLDLDWEYPAFRDGSSEDDKDNYVKLIQELREAFEKESKESGKERLLLTVAMPAGQDYIDNGFDVPKISKYVDFMNLLTYDYYTSYDPETGHHSPLSAHSGLSSFDDGKKLNVEWTVNYYLDKGAPRSKLVVGLPTYGRSFTLIDAENHRLKSAAEGPGEQGLATREKGYLAYFEICQKIKDENWKVDNQYPKNLGPQAYKDKQWVAYDDVEMFLTKADFILQNGLGGAMVWTLDNDDFRGSCNNQQSPLISALKEALFNPKNKKVLAENSISRQIQPSPSSDKPVRTVSRAESNVRKQIQNSRRPFGSSQSPSTSTSTTTTTTTTTTEPPTEITTITSSEPEFTTPDPGVDFKCEDEGFFRNAKDCKKYFWCLDSGPAGLGVVAHTFTCPTGLFFNPQTEACDYPANVAGCKTDKKAAKKKQQSNNKKQSTTTSKSTEAPVESSTRATSTTQRNNNYSSNLRRKTTTTSTTTQAPPSTSRPIADTNQQLTPELLAAALKLAREQESSSTVNAGSNNDHLFQLLQLVKSLGGIDKVQDLLNSYNYNKKPISVGSIDFANPSLNADIHNHNRHLDDTTALVQPRLNADIHNHNRHLDGANALAQPPAILDNSPANLIQPFGGNDYTVPQRQNTRQRQQSTTTVSPFLNPSYVTPRRQIEPLEMSAPGDYSHHHSVDNDPADITRTQPRQRRPPKIEITTESATLDQATSSRTRSPFNFVYNEPMLRNQPVQPSVYENVDESLLPITEPAPARSRQNNRQIGRTNVIVEPHQPVAIEANLREQAPRPRIRGSSRQSNNVARERDNVGNLHDPATNVDGFFLYSQPTRSTRQPNVANDSGAQDKPSRKNQNNRQRQSESIGNSYSVPARVTSLTSLNNDPRSSETSSSSRKRKPAKVRISTGFVVSETPASPGVTYDEEADIIIPFTNHNEPRVSSATRNTGNSRRKNQETGLSGRSAYAHHHSHNVLDHSSILGPNSIEIPSLNDAAPQPISRKPSPVRRRPPQRPHILNNPNALVEGDSSPMSRPHSGDSSIEHEPFVRNSNGRGTTLNPFSNYDGIGLSSVTADVESTRISSPSNDRRENSAPSIHSLAEDLESNYNGNTDLFSNNVGHTSPVNSQSPSTSYSSGENVSNNDINTTPYITTFTTEKAMISSSINPVTESETTVHTTTTTTAPISSLATVSSRGRDSSNSRDNGLGNVRRGRPSRPNSNSRNIDTTSPQSIVQPKRVTSSPPVTRSPPVTSPPQPSRPSSSPSPADGEPLVWDPASNKVTCNRRGVHSHPQSCGQFVVCAPSKGQVIKAIQHHCPAQQVFVKEVGRCKPGDRNTCKAFLKA